MAKAAKKRTKIDKIESFENSIFHLYEMFDGADKEIILDYYDAGGSKINFFHSTWSERDRAVAQKLIVYLQRFIEEADKIPTTET